MDCNVLDLQCIVRELHFLPLSLSLTLHPLQQLQSALDLEHLCIYLLQLSLDLLPLHLQLIELGHFALDDSLHRRSGSLRLCLWLLGQGRQV